MTELPDRTTPLDVDEEAAWRAFARAVLVVPRVLEADLLTGCGLSLVEYVVLVNLSEAPGRALRMNELAAESVLSTSGTTRVVERMARQGLVERRSAETDGRGLMAVLTDAGLRRLKEAYPHALASVRSNVMDHLAGLDLAAFARAVGSFAADREQPTARGRRPTRRQG
ncbi:MarR family winged helix-turn-helix transcriptional regulator [Streptomyces sp. NPDC002680]|uniref:MarR family winged helix-turn-helix transcriptional regulator n=1 Tax=Streptomyces sp. NPDC002680 TaxID=3364659 RepID=UPI0036C531DA